MANHEIDNAAAIAEFIAQYEKNKAKTKEERNREILSEGFLPVNDEYAPARHCSMEVVEKTPRKFIIEECIPACKKLWNKNIYTFMVSDHRDSGCCWIEVDIDNLSDENKVILMQLEGEGVFKFENHEGKIAFGVEGVGTQAQTRLLELAQQFQMQDVPYGEAYITLSEYLIRCGCYDEVENSNYVSMVEPWNTNLSGEQLGNYMVEYSEWKNSDRSKPTVKVFNTSKITKTLEEYFNENDAIYDGDRVYLSDYHYRKHMNYVNGLIQLRGAKHMM